jgi:SAM-dependent methyltransferase
MCFSLSLLILPLPSLLHSLSLSLSLSVSLLILPLARSLYSVYLFHELPEEVRSEVVKEWYRVLKPGGKIFFVDSAQAGEVPYDRVLEVF